MDYLRGNVYRSLIIAVFGLLIQLPNSHAGALNENTRGTHFAQIAAELLKTMDWSFKPNEVCERLGGQNKYCASVKKRKNPAVAIQPFDEDDIPISLSLAEEFNQHLQRALFRRGGSKYTFVARKNIDHIVADREAMGALDDGPTNFIDTLLQKNAEIDILIIGRIRVKKDTAILSYDAQGMDGRKLATAVSYLPLTPEELSGENENIPHRFAVKRLAKDIKTAVPNMASVSFCGINYEDSHNQPPFGRWFSNQLAAHLDREYASILTGERLRIDGTCSKTARPDRKTHVRLTGSYWVFSDRIDLKVTLNAGSPTITSIKRTTDLPRLRPRGRSFDDYVRNDGVGPFKFQLTTDRGRRPVYYIKTPREKITLRFKTGRNASIYCFAIDKRLSVIQIFPNKFFNKSKTKNKLKQGKWHNIPNQNWSFDIFAEPPAGKDLVKCFAATRNITKDLPRALRGLTFSPVPKAIAQKLVEIFGKVPRVAIAEASVLLTTIKADR